MKGLLYAIQEGSPEAMGFHYGYHYLVPFFLRPSTPKECRFIDLCGHLHRIYLIQDVFAYDRLQNPQWVKFFDSGIKAHVFPRKWSKKRKEVYGQPLPLLTNNSNRKGGAHGTWSLDLPKYEADLGADLCFKGLFKHFASMEISS